MCLCPIHSPTILLNRPGRFARRPDTRFGRRANRSVHIYAYQLFSLPDSIPTKDILPITLQIGNGNTESEAQPELDNIWASNHHVTKYGQQLPRQVSVRFNIDPAKGNKSIWTIRCLCVPRGVFIIKNKNKVILKAKGRRDNLKLWCDGFKMENKGTRATVVWETDGSIKEWQDRKVVLGLNKKILYVEKWGISEVFKVAKQKTPANLATVDY